MDTFNVEKRILIGDSLPADPSDKVKNSEKPKMAPKPAGKDER